MSYTVYISESHDPYLNLAAENWLFTSFTPPDCVLFLCTNSDAVVIGRHQNPWKECNLAAMEQDGVPLVRRQSGGGTVYHDPGNENFTFIAGNDAYNQERQFAVVIAALAKLGITAERSGRHDLLVAQKKVSGSAFKYKKDRSFHHGTLLVTSDLPRLRRYLQAPVRNIESKGIPSVRSHVANLSDYRPDLAREELREALIAAWADYVGRTPDVRSLSERWLVGHYEIANHARELAEWEWLYGRTPDFEEHFPATPQTGTLPAGLRVSVHRGRVRDVSLSADRAPRGQDEEPGPNRIVPGEASQSEDPPEEHHSLDAELTAVLTGLAYSSEAFRVAADTATLSPAARPVVLELARRI